eukprot:707413-Alexandrium_andersonii.AAC.1
MSTTPPRRRLLSSPRRRQTPSSRGSSICPTAESADACPICVDRARTGEAVAEWPGGRGHSFHY